MFCKTPPARVSDIETFVAEEVYLSASKHHTPYPLLSPFTFNLSGKHGKKDEINITQIKEYVFTQSDLKEPGSGGYVAVFQCGGVLVVCVGTLPLLKK